MTTKPLVYAPAVTGVFVFILDRATKLFFQSAPLDRWSAPARIVTLVRHENYGIVANFPLPLAVTLITTISVIALVYRALRTELRRGEIGRATALGLLLGGAFGNLFDRLAQGYVFDWILLFGRSAINLADMAIMAGLLWYLITYPQHPKNLST